MKSADKANPLFSLSFSASLLRGADRRFHVFILAAFLLFAFHCGLFSVSCVDIGFHLRTGELFRQTGMIPSSNTFSFTMPEHPWMLHQWLPAFLYYLAERAGGLAGLIGFKAALGALIFLVVWLSCRLLAGKSSCWPFWACTAGVMLARIRFFERPYMFSAVFLGLLFYIVTAFKTSRGWKWLGIPLLMALWANVHMEVVNGFALLCCAACADWTEWLWSRIRRARSAEKAPVPIPAGGESGLGRLLEMPVSIAISILLAGASVSLVNPNGLKVLAAPVNFYLEPFWRDFIAELLPASGGYGIFLYAWIAALLALQAIARRHFRLDLCLYALCFGTLACRTQRAALAFVVVSTPYLAFLLERALPVRAAGQGSRAALARLPWTALPLAWLALLTLVIIPDPTFRYGIGYHRPYYPLALFDFIRSSVPRQNLYNEMMYGGPILWKLYPDFRPFVDGRGEAYSMDFWKHEYAPVHRGEPVWRGIFGKYGVHGAIISNLRGAQPSPLALQLRGDPQWALVGFDDNTLLFVERTEANAALVRKHEFKTLWPADWSLAGLDANPAESAAEAGRALKTDPDCLFARTALARALMVSGRYREALPHYEALLREPGAGPNYRRDCGYCLYMTGQYDRAGELFRRMLSLNMEPAFACYMLHFIAARNGKPRDARLLLEKARTSGLDPASYSKAKEDMERTQGSASP